MAEKKVSICCGDEADLCQDFSCSVEEIDNGLCIKLTSDDPKTVGKLKTRMQSCCDSSSDKSCC